MVWYERFSSMPGGCVEVLREDWPFSPPTIGRDGLAEYDQPGETHTLTWPVIEPGPQWDTFILSMSRHDWLKKPLAYRCL